MGRYLLVGVPRSGTSWAGETLGRTAGVRYVDEPDGFREAFPFRVMLRYGENPALAPDDPAPDYARLWHGAFAGGQPPHDPRGRLGQLAFHRAGTEARRRARSGAGTNLLLRLAAAAAQPPQPDLRARHVLVKSVQCTRALDWIDAHFAPRVILLFRSPLNTLASWRELGFVRNPRETQELTAYARSRWGVEAPGPDAPALAHQTFTFAVLTAAMHAAAAAHPRWTVAHHEDLCLDAPARFRALADSVGLEWTDEAEEFLRESDRGGAGFATNRVTREQPDRWRERLDDDDVRIIHAVLDEFPDAARSEP
jgi:hypothetical protein